MTDQPTGHTSVIDSSGQEYTVETPAEAVPIEAKPKSLTQSLILETVTDGIDLYNDAADYVGRVGAICKLLFGK